MTKPCWIFLLFLLLFLLLVLAATGCAHREAFENRVEATRHLEGQLARIASLKPLPEAWRAAWNWPGSPAATVTLRGIDFQPDGSVATFVAELELREALYFLRRILRARLAGRIDARGRLQLDPPDQIVMSYSPNAAFEDVTKSAGLTDIQHAPDLDVENHLVRGIWPGSGAGAADYDGDGDPDLLVIDGRRSILYQNDGHAHFRDVTSQVGLEGLVGTGVAFADLDRDGDPDLFVTNAFGGNRLFENRGGSFHDRTSSSGTGKSPKGSSVAVSDYDGDGLLDLYVCNSGDYYSYLPDPVWNARNGYRNALFRNDGNLRFTDRAEQAGVASTGWSLAAAFADYDLDGDPDLYVANDFGLNQLYRNRGDGTFEEVTKQFQAGARGYGMSVTWQDVDDDGREDIYVSNIESHYGFLLDEPSFPLPFIGRIFRRRVIPMMRQMLAGNSLLLNRGEEGFEDKATSLGAARGGWSWGALFLDYDLDGKMDIFAPNGFVSQPSREESELDFWIDTSERWNAYRKGEAVFSMKGRSLHGHQRDDLFRQLAGGRFREVAFLEGADLEGDARGVVRADFDQDTRPDLYIRQSLARGALLLNRTRRKGIAFDLRRQDGTPALLARVSLTAGGNRQVRVLHAHEGYFSSQQPLLIIGIGDAEAAENVRITWPDGAEQLVGRIPRGTYLKIREGESPAFR